MGGCARDALAAWAEDRLRQVSTALPDCFLLGSPDLSLEEEVDDRVVKRLKRPRFLLLRSSDPSRGGSGCGHTSQLSSDEYALSTALANTDGLDTWLATDCVDKGARVCVCVGGGVSGASDGCARRCHLPCSRR